MNGCSHKLLTILSMAAMIAVAILAIPGGDVDGNGLNSQSDNDLGDFYYLQVGFNYAGGGAASVEWDFGDGGSDVGFIVTHSYREPGTYNVTQTAKNPGYPDAVCTYIVHVHGSPVISFDTNGGNTIDPIEQPNPDFVIPYPTPVKEGYDFFGWYAEYNPSTGTFNKLLDPTIPVKESTTLYARWIPDGETILVTFDTNGGLVDGKPEYGSTRVGVNETPAEPPVPVKEGYEFIGWYITNYDGTEVKYEFAGGLGLEDCTLKAHWGTVSTESGSNDTDSNKLDIDTTSIIMIVAGIAIILLALIFFPPAALVGIIAIAVSVLRILGVL